VTIEERIMKRHVSGGYGSLYYRGDIEAVDSRDIFIDGDLDNDFVLGPSTDRSFWEGERQSMVLDRGPWSDPLSYITSFAKRESQWILQHGKVNLKPSPFDPPIHVQLPGTHISLLNLYMKVAPHLIPSDASLTRPTLWHTDLHGGNIFVSNDTSSGQMDICAIIDWQHLHVAPLYLQARVPRFIRYQSPTPLTIDPSVASLTPNTATDMDLEGERAIDADLATRHAKYVAIHDSHNTDYGKALTLVTRDLIVPPVQFAGYTWSGGLVPLRDCLIRISDHWSDLQQGEAPCPVHFSDLDRHEHRVQAKDWQDAVDGRRDMNDCLGVGEDGWVPLDNYDEAVAANEMLKTQFLEDLNDPVEAASFVWPYQP